MTDRDTIEALTRLFAERPVPDVLEAVEGQLPTGSELEVYLWDYQRRTATGIRSGRAVDRDELGAVIASASAVRTLGVHGEAVGLLVLDGSDIPDGLVQRLADLLGMAIRASEPVSDIIAIRRRTRSMSLPAEMQWRALPPSQFEGEGIRISAAVEPAYDTGGDIFDYTLSGRSLFIAVLDARGHGLQASTTATIATSAMRRSRRNGDDLLGIAQEMHTSIGAMGDDEDYVSAILLELDVDRWTGRWLSAGHLPPLLVSDDELTSLPLRPALPLGMVVRGQSTEPVVQEFTLDQGQSLVLYSDGIIENAAKDDGLALGEERFRRTLLDRIGGGGGELRHVARAVVEDLLAVTGPSLRDDATLIVVERPV